MVSVVQTAVRRDRRQQARHERRDVSTLRHTGGHRVARGTYLFKQPALMTGAFAHDDALTVHNMVGQPLPDVAESPRVDAPHGPLLLDDADDMPQDRILCPRSCTKSRSPTRMNLPRARLSATFSRRGAGSTSQSSRLPRVSVDMDH